MKTSFVELKKIRGAAAAVVAAVVAFSCHWHAPKNTKVVIQHILHQTAANIFFTPKLFLCFVDVRNIHYYCCDRYERVCACACECEGVREWVWQSVRVDALGYARSYARFASWVSGRTLIVHPFSLLLLFLPLFLSLFLALSLSLVSTHSHTHLTHFTTTWCSKGARAFKSDWRCKYRYRKSLFKADNGNSFSFETNRVKIKIEQKRNKSIFWLLHFFLNCCNKLRNFDFHLEKLQKVNQTEIRGRKEF